MHCGLIGEQAGLGKRFAWRRFFSSFLALRSIARRMDRAAMIEGSWKMKMARRMKRSAIR
jgi:hypothetical protein